MKEMSSPKEYCALAEYFGLSPDYDTYPDVIKKWMKSNKLFFCEDMNVDDLPDNLLVAFNKVVNEITAETYERLEKEVTTEAGVLYADLLIINEKNCLVTGMGRTDACNNSRVHRLIAAIKVYGN